MRVIKYGLSMILCGVALMSSAFATENSAVLQKITHYMQNLATVKGDFVQIGPDGVLSDGKFYMNRPGKMRFEYKPPTPILVISDGFWVALEDTELKTQDRYPLSSTPLGILLDKKIDFSKSNYIRSIEQEKGTIRILASDPENADQGTIMLVFTSDPVELKQWVVTDAQGLQTTVTLHNVLKGMPLQNALFYIENDTKKGSTRFSR